MITILLLRHVAYQKGKLVLEIATKSSDVAKGFIQMAQKTTVRTAHLLKLAQYDCRHKNIVIRRRLFLVDESNEHSDAFRVIYVS